MEGFKPHNRQEGWEATIRESDAGGFDLNEPLAEKLTARDEAVERINADAEEIKEIERVIADPNTPDRVREILKQTLATRYGIDESVTIQ